VCIPVNIIYEKISKARLKAKGISTDKKNTRRHTAKKRVIMRRFTMVNSRYAYQKSDDAGNNDKNTAGPSS
jgi:hypothetical protein